MRPRRRRFATLVVALLMLGGTAPSAAAAESPPKLTPTGTDVLARNSWIVTLAPGVDLDRAGAIAKKAGGRAGLTYDHVLHGFQFKGSAAAAKQLERSPLVESVEPDRPLFLTETLPFGVDRIHAWGFAGPEDGAYQAGFRGAGTRIGILDTGIDLDHPDLAASIDQAAGANCIDPTLAPEDGHGHGTHVSGSAAAPLNGVGVVGVAPEAKLIPIKMFDDAGNSSLARSLCALNRVVGLNTDGNAANDIDVVNMSWGEHRTWVACGGDDLLHNAICSARASGAILVAGAGNDARDAGSFVPAAYPEVISVSAYSDFDGDSGGRQGCQFVLTLFWTECDDTFAFFSDFGASVDVMGPGVNVFSTWKGGGYQTIDGTSMATPHVAGTVALLRGVDPDLTPDEALALLRSKGECPNGAVADADGTAGCAGQGTWRDDPDGIPEPLVNALAAARAAGAVQPPAPTPPSAPQLTGTAADRSATLQWTAPSNNGGAAISAYTVYRRIGSGSESAVGSTNGSTFQFVDSNLTNGTQYTYRVAAVNSAGEGAKSNAVALTPVAPAITAPGAPTNLRATAKVVGSVNLTWTAPAQTGSSAIEGYHVYRKGPGQTSFTQIRTVLGATVTTYTDSSPELARRTTYIYVVSAFNASLEGAVSNEASVRTK